MHVVFDLEGVVIDTESVVARCYELAGATPPPSILAYEGSDWLHEQVNGRRDLVVEIKRRKNVLYQNVLRSGGVPWLTGALAAAQLARLGRRVHLLSGAPSGTISIVKELWSTGFPQHPWPFSLIIDGMKTPDKMKMIRLLSSRSSGSHGVYVDDQTKFIDLPSHWRFVHFTREFGSPSVLVREILRKDGE